MGLKEQLLKHKKELGTLGIVIVAAGLYLISDLRQSDQTGAVIATIGALETLIAEGDDTPTPDEASPILTPVLATATFTATPTTRSTLESTQTLGPTETSTSTPIPESTTPPPTLTPEPATPTSPEATIKPPKETPTPASPLEPTPTLPYTPTLIPPEATTPTPISPEPVTITPITP